MLFWNKKIRQLNKDLDAAKKPAGLDGVTSALENLAPAAANSAFKKDLRQKLLHKYTTMSVANKENSAAPQPANRNSKRLA